MTVAVFGPIVTENDVEQQVIAALKRWLPTHLAEMERRTGRDAGVLPVPRSWSTVSEFDQPPDAAVQLPAGIVVSPGTLDTPAMQGDGSYSVWFEIRVAILVAGQDRQNASELAKLYAACVVLSLLQHPSLDGFASAIEWDGTSNAPLPENFMNTGWATECAFAVLVEGVMNRFAGPATPDLAPTDPPAVATAEVAVQREEPT